MVPTCPFSVRLRRTEPGRNNSFVFDEYIFRYHCYALPNERAINKDIIQYEMDLIKERKNRDGNLQRRRDEWQEQALGDAIQFKRELLEKETAVTYAVDHPMMSDREVEIECGFKMSREAIDMARKRKMQSDDDYTLENIITQKASLA